MAKRDLGEVYLEQLSNSSWDDIVESIPGFDEEELGLIRDALARRNEEMPQNLRLLSTWLELLTS